VGFAIKRKNLIVRKQSAPISGAETSFMIYMVTNALAAEKIAGNFYL
jgi:hypothetical protein